MKIFSPYIVLEDSPSKLHLRENKFRRIISSFFLRVFPFTYLLFTVLFLITKNETVPPIAGFILIAGLIIPAIIIFRAKLVLEVAITKMSVDVVYITFSKLQETSYSIPLIDYISKRRRGGKAPAYIYSVVTKVDNKKHRMFKIP